jgi:hypothetical protein
MKRWLLLVVLGLFSKAYGQINRYHYVIVDKDTLTIQLTDAELEESKKNRVLELKHNTRHRKKKLLEKISCEIRLSKNDTIFYCDMVDYFDSYFIAFLGTIQSKSKHERIVKPIGFRKINYSDLMWIRTDGKQNIKPQLWFSAVVLWVGTYLTAYSMRESFRDHGDAIAPYLVPVGLGVTYLGGKLFGDILTFEYYLPDWKIQVKDIKQKKHR